MSDEQWKASATQHARVQRFETWLLGYVQAAKEAGRLDDDECAIRNGGEDSPFCSALQQEFEGEAEQHLADFFMFPVLHESIPNMRARADSVWSFARDVSDLLTEAVKKWGRDYTCHLALQRLRYQLSHPADATECAAPRWMDAERKRIRAQFAEPIRGYKLAELKAALSRSFHPFLEPAPDTLGGLICEMKSSRAQLDELLDLMERSCDIWVDEQFQPPPQVEDCECEGRMRTSEFLGLTDFAEELAQSYARFGPLDPVWVQRLFEVEWPRAARVVNTCLRQDEEILKDFQPEALDWVYAHCAKPLAEAISSLSKLANDWGVDYERDTERSLRGIRFVVAGARLLAQMPSPPPLLGLVQSDADRPAARALKLICNVQPLSAAESAELVAELRQFTPEVLLQLLRHCRAQADEVLEAMGWGSAAPLYRFMRERERADANEYFDVLLLKEYLQRAGKSGELLLAWHKKYKHLKVTMHRIEAVQGVEDKRLAGMLGKLSQEHIRVWGMVPIRDSADLRERFDFFKGAGKQASKMYGSERTANVRDAAAAALVQLAHNAGFADVTEMEWSLDASSYTAQDWAWQQDEYAVELNLVRFQPQLQVRKAGKALKSLPPALKKDPGLAPLLAQLDLLKDQSKRYRTALENLMVSGRTLTPDQLRELSHLPMARQLLSALYLQTPDGGLGLLDDSLTQLRLLDAEGRLADEPLPVEQPLTIAHVHAMLVAGRLIACQRHAVQSSLVQPFKQAFRECYVLTPAEREAHDLSRRFEGRRVKTSVLGAILSARGWRIDGGEGDCTARKRLTPDIAVELSLPDVYHFLTEEEATVLGEISFYRQGVRVALEEAPALGFSEAMRDLDLVITAGAADSDEHSAEVQHARVALVDALLPSLGLKNVSVEGHHAIIQGKRASYRLHLGTAVIHVIPAGYLCIVPADKASQKSVALPFVDDDQRTSEVLSKLLLLSADDKIKDPSILAQIEGRVAQA
ncbi:DUF4132 domain-containing protein [Acidovorax sp. 1608163]|uniref:DUF4132 domain-containing protein n=1 Tax=Acidovorax sp. 1608163 TaxID=2478662 RepID=UPI000EF74C75|nr:DUF4132 domain-containing protein [Acidovorax sp. 1608163]AYM97159.1 DUF4132 domain-containing protein [Acidovorax sp. 1608163]